MIAAKTILISWIADINANLKVSLGLNTVASHEPSYDLQALAALMPLCPAILLRYENLVPIEDFADGGGALFEQQVSIVFLAESALSPDERRAGCLDMIDAFRAKYNGGSIIVGAEQINLKVKREGYMRTFGDVSAYYAFYSFMQN